MFNNQSKNNSTDPKKCVVTDPKKDTLKVTDPKKDAMKAEPKKDDRIKH